MKWFLTKIGTEGLYNLLSSWEDKTAAAVCLFAYSSGVNEEIKVFEGKVSGLIVKPRGSTEFGWDVSLIYISTYCSDSSFILCFSSLKSRLVSSRMVTTLLLEKWTRTQKIAYLIGAGL